MLRITVLIIGFCLTFGSLFNFVTQFAREAKKAGDRGIPSYALDGVLSNLVWTMLGVFMLAAGLGES